MKLIETSPEVFKIHALKSFLEKEDIQCFINNENLIQLSGEVPLGECFLELYVEDSDFEKAFLLYKSFQKPKEFVQTWKCLDCDETIAEQFEMCWKCGALKVFD